jgi:manganese/iron transport system permease protein
MFALGIALISSVRNYAVDLTHFMFGNVLGVTQNDLWLTAGVGVAVLIIILVFYKEFLVLSFDSTLVTTLRLPVRALEILLSILMAVAVVVSLQTVGVALVVALLVTPPAAAFLVTKNLRNMMALASLIAAASAVIGLFASYYLNIASGAAIVLTCTMFFILIWIWRQFTMQRRRRKISASV